jgi:hypothetical protein
MNNIMLKHEELKQLKKLIETFRILDYTKEDIQKVLKINEKDLTQICKYYGIL